MDNSILLDGFKLFVPLGTAIVMVWIKSWGERRINVSRQRHALCRILADEIRSYMNVVEKLKRVSTALEKGEVTLAIFRQTAAVSTLSMNLCEHDPQRAYQYANIAASAEIIAYDLDQLATLTLAGVQSAGQGVADGLRKAICKIIKNTANDLVALGEEALKFIESSNGSGPYF